MISPFTLRGGLDRVYVGENGFAVFTNINPCRSAHQEKI
jgi:hypothetical protein